MLGDTIVGANLPTLIHKWPREWVWEKSQYGLVGTRQCSQCGQLDRRHDESKWPEKGPEAIP